MKITYDPAKDSINIAKHGISLGEAVQLNFDTATVIPDTRYDYGEKRYQATGFIDDRLHVMIFTPRNNELRIISLRKANLRERKKYGK